MILILEKERGTGEITHAEGCYVAGWHRYVLVWRPLFKGSHNCRVIKTQTTIWRTEITRAKKNDGFGGLCAVENKIDTFFQVSEIKEALRCYFWKTCG